MAVMYALILSANAGSPPGRHGGEMTEEGALRFQHRRVGLSRWWRASGPARTPRGSAVHPLAGCIQHRPAAPSRWPIEPLMAGRVLHVRTLPRTHGIVAPLTGHRIHKPVPAHAELDHDLDEGANWVVRRTTTVRTSPTSGRQATDDAHPILSSQMSRHARPGRTRDQTERGSRTFVAGGKATPTRPNATELP